MKAVISEVYGGPEVLQIEDVPVPKVGPNGVLVRVHAAGVNPLDWKLRNGDLRAFRSFRFPVILGADLSGIVAEVGTAVSLFKPGDEVYGFKDGFVGQTYRGSYAEYAVVPENALAKKPPKLSHEEAASIPLAALTAWQALITKGKMRSGSRVLIQAGAGGVGVMAIQISKAMGAFVAATASGRNQELLRQLGADLPINYEVERVEDRVSGLNLVLDGVGIGAWRSSLVALKRGGRLVTIVAPTPPGQRGKLGFYAHTGLRMGAYTTLALLAGKRLSLVRVKPRGGELEKITALIETGKVKPVVDRTFQLEEVAEAHQLSQAGHVRGKIVLTINS